MLQAPNTEALDEHVKGVVDALHGAVNSAMRHLDDPKIVDQAIKDCKEILDEVMKGKVEAWIK
jgi:phage shock protein A